MLVHWNIAFSMPPTKANEINNSIVLLNEYLSFTNTKIEKKREIKIIGI